MLRLHPAHPLEQGGVGHDRRWLLPADQLGELLHPPHHPGFQVGRLGDDVSADVGVILIVL